MYSYPSLMLDVDMKGLKFVPIVYPLNNFNV